MWKKIISTAIAVAMVFAMCGNSVDNIKAGSEDGDICTNPWEELFTTTELKDFEFPTEDTTTKRETTTNEGNTANKVIKIGKGKVLKATRKNKKVRITLKKIKGAKGYQIQISKTKKFKKILISKKTNKRKIAITSKNLKNKKRLYVRARAYKFDKKAKVWGKWSTVKMIKIKKK